jgi:FixJ family two-component response regulator
MSNPWNLSSREIEVLEGFVEKPNGKSVARSLGIAAATVDQHVWNARLKMGGVARIKALVLWDRFKRGAHCEA